MTTKIATVAETNQSAQRAPTEMLQGVVEMLPQGGCGNTIPFWQYNMVRRMAKLELARREEKMRAAQAIGSGMPRDGVDSFADYEPDDEARVTFEREARIAHEPSPVGLGWEGEGDEWEEAMGAGDGDYDDEDADRGMGCTCHDDCMGGRACCPVHGEAT